MTVGWRLLAFVFFAVLTPSARAVIDEVIDKTFDVKTPAVVTAETFSGGITVTARDDSRVRVLVRQTVEAEDEKAAEALLSQLVVTLEQRAGGEISLNIRPRHQVRWTWQNWSPASLAIEITVPRVATLTLRSGEGAVTVGGLKGDVNARVASGSVFVGEIEGSVTAWNGRGDVSVTACSGALKLTSKSGNVLVGRTGGHATLSAVDGVIEVQAARGVVVAKGNRTDIKVSFVHPLQEACDLSADGGDVTAGFDPRSAATLNARASTFGSVRVRGLEIAAAKGKPGESILTGTLNGGGPLIKIRASGGHVRLNAVPSL